MNDIGLKNHFAIIIIVGLTAACAGAERTPSASNLLDRYTKALDSTKCFIDHYEESSDYSFRLQPTPAGRVSRGKKFKRGQYRYDDQRIYFQSYTWGNYAREFLPEDTPYYHCHIADGKDKKTYQHNKRINNPNFPTGSAARFPYERPIKVVLSRNGGVSYLVGYIGSDERLDAILRKARRISVRETTENIRGSDCYVIDAYTKYGKYSVWLDPEHGYHPAKVMNKAKKGDYVHTHLLYKGDTAMSYLDNVHFEKVDGIWVPMEADAGFERMVGGNLKNFNKEDRHFKRTKIILNPDHDKLGSFADPIFEDPNNDPELRNGTRVRINFLHTQYTWQDGEPIPNIDEAVISELDKVAEGEVPPSLAAKKESEAIPQTVLDLLDKYAENLSKRQSYIIKTESSVIGSKLYDRRIRNDRVKYNAGELRFDGDRASSRYHMWGHVSPQIEVTKDLALYQSRLWDVEDFYQYDLSIHLPKPPKPFGTVIITRGKEKSNEKYNRSILTVRNHSCAPLMGFFEYDAERVDRILRQADNISVRDKLEKIGGSNCYVIEARTKRGKYTLWIDPEHGYNIAKAENIKQAGDVTFSHDFLLKDKAKISYFLENVRFEKIDDLWVPIEADMRNSRILHNGKFYIASKMHVKLVDIVLNPDHDTLGSFVPDDIKNGATVYVKGVKSITYTWKDGQVVDDKGNVIMDCRPKKPTKK